MAKYIFVTGGVTSSLGKGIIAASLAKLLQARGAKGLAYILVNEDGTLGGPVSKNISESEQSGSAL